MTIEEYPELNCKIEYGEPVAEAYIDFRILFLNGDKYVMVMTGNVRWDGCVNVSGPLHFCEPEHIDRHAAVFKKVYEYAEQIPGFLD